MSKIKIGDIVIIGVILLITLGVLCFRLINVDRGEFVSISVGENVDKYNLNENQTIDINNKDISLTVVIQDNQVYVKSTDCPEKSCMNMGKISKSGECIACVPARVYIKIEGKGSADYDYVIG
ncbi:MAG: NusG domain II-containing protein [Ruminococcaceae bacterium]|nr:NusG domain II-containing protein [Oscillospiraceae bacterium]